MYNNRNNNSQGYSWALIVILFALGLWPIAMPLLFLKLFAPNSLTNRKTYYHQAPSLSEAEAKRQAAERAAKLERERQNQEAKQKLKSILDTPAEGKPTYTRLMVFGAITIAIAMVFLFGMTSASTVGQILFDIALFISGGALIGSGIQMKGAMGRYTRYKALIGKNDAIEIEGLANKTGYSKRRVMKDLQKMIENGDFGESAYINKELGYMFVSSEADERLKEAKEAALEKARKAANSEAAKQSANVYDQLLYQIRDVNDRIPGEEMTAKIDQIEDITRKIFEVVEKEPEKRSKIDRFMTYYLPTTLKLLEHYASLDQTNVEGENISKAKQSIENTMDSIVDGFRLKLDDLYKNDTLDIETDIDVLNQLLDRDKAKSEFKSAKTSTGEVSLGGQAAQTK